MKQGITYFKKSSWLYVLLTSFVGLHAQAQLRIGAPSRDPINPAASLDVKSGPYSDNTYRGLLLPRVALTNYGTWTLAGAPTDGMLVFNTAISTGMYAVTPGVYCWYNFQWNRQSQADATPAMITAISCQSATAATGMYYPTIPLTASNTKQVSVVPGSAGAYSITTNTVNGYSFSSSGKFTTAQVGSPQPIVLQGIGMPQVAQADTFTLATDTQTCSFKISVPNYEYVTCTGPLTGTYKVNQALGATNTKQITIIPKVAGNYYFLSVVYTPDIENYFTFIKRDVMITAAQVGIPQTITLQGEGTPKVAGTYSAVVQVSTEGGQNFTIGCNFAITIEP